MVKGTSKHIVVVKAPEPGVFEKAIFVVRDDFIGGKGRTDALDEAQRIAASYLRDAVIPGFERKRRGIPFLIAAAAVLLSALTALLIHLL